MTEEKKAKRRSPRKNTDDYIEHEPITTPENGDAQAETVEVEAEEITPEQQLKLEVVKLKLSDSSIHSLFDQYGDLTINGPTDKSGYKAVKAAWGEVRSVRTGLQKRGLEIRNRIAIVTKGVKKEEDRLIDLLAPLEEKLEQKWKAIDEEKEREEKERAEAEQKLLMDRLQELVGMGMKLVDGFYRIGQTISMDIATLRSLPEDQYVKLKQTVQAKANEIAEAQRLKAEEEEKERVRLKEAQNELQRKQDELQQERLEMMRARREIRLGKLEALGFQLTNAGNVENMFFRKLAINVNKILEASAQAFTEFLDEMTTKVQIIKDEEAKEQEEATRKTGRHKLLHGQGFTLINGVYVYDNGYKIVKAAETTMMQISDADFEAELQMLIGQVGEADTAKMQHDKEVEQEKKQLEEKQKKIGDLLNAAGMTYNFTHSRFEFANPHGHVIATWNELLPLNDTELESKVNELTTTIVELQDKERQAVKDKEKKEKQDNEAKMTDRQRWESFVSEAIGAALDPSKFKTKVFKDKAQAYLDWLTHSLK